MYIIYIRYIGVYECMRLLGMGRVSWGRCVLLHVHLVFSRGPGGDASSNGVQNGGHIFEGELLGLWAGDLVK